MLNCVTGSASTVPENTTAVLTRLDQACALTREHLKQTAASMSTWYNRKVRVRSFVPEYVYITRDGLWVDHLSGSHLTVMSALLNRN